MDSRSDIYEPGNVSEQLDRTLDALQTHLDQIAEVVAEVQGREYGKLSQEINGAVWTLKHEDGSAVWLRRTIDDEEVYLLSTKSKPKPSELIDTLDSYPMFVAMTNNWIDRQAIQLSEQESKLDEAEDLLEDLADDADDLIKNRDHLESELWDAVDVIADSIQRVTGNKYGTMKSTVNGQKWKLKYEKGDGTQYLQIDGTYALGEYDSPRPRDLAIAIENLPEYAENINGWLERKESELHLSVTVRELGD